MQMPCLTFRRWRSHYRTQAWSLRINLLINLKAVNDWPDMWQGDIPGHQLSLESLNSLVLTCYNNIEVMPTLNSSKVIIIIDESKTSVKQREGVIQICRKFKQKQASHFM